MQWTLALALVTTIGVDAGWQPIEDGSLEYIIQIEPQLLESLKPGDEISVGIRPELRNVRRYRIVVGEGVLPQDEGQLPSAAAAENPISDSATAAVTNDVPPSSTELPNEISLEARSDESVMEIPHETPIPIATALKSPEGDSAEVTAESVPAVDAFERYGVADAETENNTENIAEESPLDRQFRETASEIPPNPFLTPSSHRITPPQLPATFSASEDVKPVAFGEETRFESATTITPEPETIATEPPIEPANESTNEIVPSAATETPKPSDDAQSQAEPTTAPVKAETVPRPWWVLTFVTLFLFASLGGNVYLGWIFLEARIRYQNLATKMTPTRTNPA